MRIHSDFAAVFAPGAQFRARSGELASSAVREVGALHLSGRIVFGAPSALTAARTLLRPVAAGAFPVELAVRDGIEPAAARVRLSTQETVRWEPALAAGEDLDDLRPGEYFGSYVGNRAFAVLHAADTVIPSDPLALFPDWAGGCDARCASLPGGGGIAVLATPGPGTYAAYWGLGQDGTLTELVIDLNGFLENDVVDITLDVQGSTPRRVPVPVTRLVGDVRLVERKDRLVVEVGKKRSSEISLRGYTRRVDDSPSVTRYEFEPHVTAVTGIVHFGLRRMDRA